MVYSFYYIPRARDTIFHAEGIFMDALDMLKVILYPCINGFMSNSTTAYSYPNVLCKFNLTVFSFV